MQEKEVIKLLQRFKDDPAMGGHFDFQKRWGAFANKYGFNPNIPSPHYTFRDYVETYLWQFTHSMLKPMAATLAVFVFAVVGSISLAISSVYALPGERLYGVKLGLEKVQLALTFTDEERAQLRVEFAGRRLEEMVELASRSESSASESVELAADRFKSEVASIREELTGDATTQTQELAKTVARKVEQYSSTVASTSDELPEEVLGEVEEVLEETKEQVVEVMITAHETQQDEESARELDEALTEEIERVRVLYGEAASDAIATAEALKGEGLYRRAFQVLKDISFELQQQEE